MRVLHLLCLPLQLRIAGRSLNQPWKQSASGHLKDFKMRIVESATAGIIALVAQILVVGTVLI